MKDKFADSFGRNFCKIHAHTWIEECNFARNSQCGKDVRGKLSPLMLYIGWVEIATPVFPQSPSVTFGKEKGKQKGIHYKMYFFRLIGLERMMM
jgi:hypothetical protein